MSEKPSSSLLDKLKTASFKAQFADLYKNSSDFTFTSSQTPAQDEDSCVQPSQLSLHKSSSTSTADGSISSAKFCPTFQTKAAAISQSKSAATSSSSTASVLNSGNMAFLEQSLKEGVDSNSGSGMLINGKPFTMADVLGSSSSSSSSSSAASQQQCSSCSCASNHIKDNTNSSNSRKTDADMKTFAFSAKLSESFWNESCSKKCECGQDCLQVFSVKDIGHIKKQFWGSSDTADFPTRTERNASISALFDKAGYNPKTEHFSFPFTSTAAGVAVQRHVCHKAAVLLLGLTNSKNETSKQWDTVARLKLDDKLGKPSAASFDAAIPKHAPQTDSVKVWLRSISGQADHAVGAGLEEKCILPAHTPSHLFKLYEASEKADGVSPENIACKKTFTNYWNAEGSKLYSLLTCKGGFPTCEICNHA